VVTRAVRVPNRAADPARAFLVSPVDLARVERAARPLGLRVIGTWHTHPHGAPEPSRADRAGAPDGWWQALAGSVHSRTVLRAFWVENGTWIPASC
jgi:proteasome lid subunit RPN8/RPN11